MTGGDFTDEHKCWGVTHFSQLSGYFFRNKIQYIPVTKILFFKKGTNIF